MLRKLILLTCLIGGTTAMAQHVGTATTKTTENKVDPKIDYKQMGAPLPSFTLLCFHDTSVKKDATIAITPAAPMTAKEKRKARRNKDAAADQATAGPKKIKTEKDFDNGANLFVMMFNPTCSHCTDETQILEKHITNFKKSKIVLMANPTMRPYLQDFVKNYHTDDYPTISVGMDSLGFMNNVFLYQALPQISIYDGDRKLIKTFTGEVVIDSLMKYIQ